MSLPEGNIERLYCVSELDANETDKVPRFAFALLHRDTRAEEERALLVKRLREAIVYAVSHTLKPESLPDVPQADLDRWRKGLQELFAALDGLSDPHNDDAFAAFVRAELSKVLEARAEAYHEYSAAFGRAISELEPTNAGRLKLALSEVRLAIREAGIERDEHFRVARHALHELLGDLEGELCAAGWALYGLLEIWVDSDLSETSRTLATALRRLRLAESALSGVCLRAKAYTERQFGDHDAALTDLTRALDASSDPDLALEALASAIELQRGTIGGRLVERCVDRSPLWAIFILGDPAMSLAHGAALYAFDRRTQALRSDVEEEIALTLKLVQCIKECSRTCGVDMSVAVNHIQTIASLRQESKTADAMMLHALKHAAQSLREVGEQLSQETLHSNLGKRQAYLAKIEARQKGLLGMRGLRMREAREWLDNEVTAVLKNHTESMEHGFVTDRAATRAFSLSCFLFLAYLGFGTYLAIYGTSPTLNHAFSYVGLIVAALPAVVVIIRQAIYSVREWTSQASVKQQVKVLQRKFETMITAISLRYENEIAAADEEYRDAKENVRRAANAIQALAEKKPVKLKATTGFKEKRPSKSKALPARKAA